MSTLQLVTNRFEVIENICGYSDALATDGQLRRSAIHTVWWYAARIDGQWLFGPSKYVGYVGMTPATYAVMYAEENGLHGGRTEIALKELFEPVHPETPLFSELHAELNRFLSTRSLKIGRKFKGFRITPRESQLVAQTGSTSTAEILTRIVSDPDICGGRPRIKGTRMRVTDIIEMLAAGATREEILADFDYISADDITASLLYAARAMSHVVLRAA